jgi:hypothetical protein
MSICIARIRVMGNAYREFLLKNVQRRNCLEVRAAGPLAQIPVKALKCWVHCYVCFPCRPGVSPCCKYSTLGVNVVCVGHGVYMDA